MLGSPNSGKSTVVQILSGAEINFRGDVYIDGISLVKQRSTYSNHIAYCPTTNPANSALTVEDTLNLLMAIFGVRPVHRKIRMDMFLNALKLEKDRKEKVIAHYIFFPKNICYK